MCETYEIPTYKIDTLKDLVEKLNKKAEKWGLSPVEMTVGEKFQKEVKLSEADGYYEPVTILVECHKVTVSGMAPVIAGWKFMATVEPTVNAECNVLLTVPGNNIPEKYRTEEFNQCDHCNKSRNRNNTYILYNEAENAWKRVGSGCINDFLGVDLSGILAHMEALRELSTGLNGDEGEEPEQERFARDKFQIKTLRFLAAALACVAEEGYKNSTYDNSTKGSALFVYFDKRKESGLIIDAQLEKAKELLTWIREKKEYATSDKDYLYNLYASCCGEYITYRMTGLVASLIPHYTKETAPVLTNSKFQGTVGQKGLVVNDLKVMASRAFDGGFGVTYMNEFVDPSGNVYVWWTGKSFDEGLKVSLKGSIKDHKVYKGVEQTILTRCKEI